LGMHRLAIDADLVVNRVHLDPELADHLAIDLHPPFENELLPRPPRSDAGIREEFLKTQHLNAEPGTRNAETEKQPVGCASFPRSAFRAPRLTKIRLPAWSYEDR